MTTDTVIEEIAIERRRQMEAEGWSPEHDDIAHSEGELGRAAACYAHFASVRDDVREVEVFERKRGYLVASEIALIKRTWPWDWHWWKPKDRRRDLIRAGALIVAEIERLDRAAAEGPQ